MYSIQDDVTEISNELKNIKEKINGKTFLITGGAGFLGSWFCDSLNSFDANIICVDNLITGSLENIQHLENKPNFRFINHDITKTLEIKENIDYIVHMASIASPPVYQKYPIETLNANVLGTINMLELAKEKNVKGFLLTSTSEVYGNPPDDSIPTPEAFPGFVSSYGPRSCYDEGKRVAEAYCFSYFKQFKLPVRIARIFNTYGPRLDLKSTSQYGRALIKFVFQALNDQPITVYGDGKQTRSFCYITDQTICLFRLLLSTGMDGEVVNIGNDNEISIIELVNKILKVFGKNVEITLNAQPNYDLTHDPRRRCPDISKARKILNYNTAVSLEEGLRRTIEWIKSSSS